MAAEPAASERRPAKDAKRREKRNRTASSFRLFASFAGLPSAGADLLPCLSGTLLNKWEKEFEPRRARRIRKRNPPPPLRVLRALRGDSSRSISRPSSTWARAFPRSCASPPLRPAEVKLRQHLQIIVQKSTGVGAGRPPRSGTSKNPCHSERSEEPLTISAGEGGAELRVRACSAPPSPEENVRGSSFLRMTGFLFAAAGREAPILMCQPWCQRFVLLSAKARLGDNFRRRA